MPDDKDDERPLSPDEEVLEESEYVVGLEDNRYLVSPSKIDQSTEREIRDIATKGDVESTEGAGGSQSAPSADVSRGTIQGSLREGGATYAFELIASIEGSQQADRIETDDVVEAFEALNRAFARGVADDVPVDEVIDILLTESTFDTTHESHSFEDVIDAYGLEPYDRINDLIEAMEQQQ